MPQSPLFHYTTLCRSPTHQAIEDISLMRGIPGMEVFAPADEEDMLLSLPAIWKSRAPSYVRANPVKPLISHERPQQFQIAGRARKSTRLNSSHRCTSHAPVSTISLHDALPISHPSGD